ncbi:MAG: hypothetical protein HY704_05635 [Gemmatimonadetes bacterium]|nr:hypothetical protein [Gemmatimonadota bacterium]
MKPVGILPLMLVLFLAGLASPGSLRSQPVRPGGPGGGTGFGGGRRPAEFDPDLLAANPLRFLLEKSDELSLDGEQRTSLEQMEGALAAKNEPLLRQLSKLRPSGPPRDPSDRDAMRARMEKMRSLVKQVRENNESAGDEALKLLSDDQQNLARRLLEERQRELEQARSRAPRERMGRPPES